MTSLLRTLYHDDAGFLVSAELILVATIAVLSLVVGLGEISFSVNNELEDVGSAVGAVQQSYFFSGLTSHRKAGIAGSAFRDHADFCDSQFDIVGTEPVGERGQHDHRHGGDRDGR